MSSRKQSPDNRAADKTISTGYKGFQLTSREENNPGIPSSLTN
jgi:hypothetical protein